MKMRLISLLLAFSMALTFLPVGAVSAFAAETGSNELDLTHDTEVKITETATYDLLPSENAQGHLVIDAPGSIVTLNLKGSIKTNVLTTNFVEVKQGTLVFNGDNYKIEYHSTSPQTLSLVHVDTGATALVNEGIFITVASPSPKAKGTFWADGNLTLTKCTSTSDHASAVYNGSSGITTIDSCVFSSVDADVIVNKGNLNIEGNGDYRTNDARSIANSADGQLTIDGGYFYSEQRYVIFDQSSQQTTINDGTFENNASSDRAVINIRASSLDKKLDIHGGVFRNLGNGRILDCAGTVTIEEQNGKKILMESTTYGNYHMIVLGGSGVLNLKSGTLKAYAAAIRTGGNVTVNITGGTISDCLYGVYVKSNPTAVNIGGNVNFENNQNDIFLEENQRITVQENYKGAMSIACKNPRENVPVTTSTYGESYQKDLKLTSVDPDYIIGYKQNEDRSEYRYLEKRTGYLVNVVSGTASIDGGTTALSPTTQVPDGTPVSLSAAPAQNGMEFEQWVVSPASALTDPDFDLTASETSFHMPDQDITLTAQYRPIPPTIDDSPVDPTISTAVTIIGGALLVGGLHQLGTELWLIHHLPKGTAIPETRIELAEVLWKDAGQPAPAAEAAYTDIDTDDTDAQQAAQWAIENELMTLRSSEHPDKFDPHVPVSTVKAIRAWKKAQQMKPSTK
ncbi:MAG: hypothetical protein UDB88_05455 [Faecalibacterium prausnitzii]|nr:hypothetical protein [Faecalibacterium prausnitzii]